MSAVIYFLKPFEREDLGKQDHEVVQEDWHPQPKQGKSGKRRYVRNPLPCGRESRWKKKMNGEVVRREREK
jgi:hypothetical protein